jgi:hypothetical protein
MIHSFRSLLRQVHSISENEFSRRGNLVLPLSISSILSSCLRRFPHFSVTSTLPFLLQYRKEISVLFGAFAKLSKTTISFAVSIRLSICLSACNNSAQTGRIFMKFYIYSLSKACRENSSFMKIRHEWRALYMKAFSHLCQNLAKILLRMRHFLDESCKKMKTYFMYNILFSKIVPFMR